MKYLRTAANFPSRHSQLARTAWAAALALCGWGTWISPLPAAPTTVAAHVLRVGEIKNNQISESSGLVASRRYPGVFWTHNDSGNDPRLFAINRQGKTLGVYRIQNPGIKDWEDLAIDDNGNLFIADIGNNNLDRNTVAVHRISEPNPFTSGKVTVQQSWRLKFPHQFYDSESFVTAYGYGYVITKQPGNGRVLMFRFPLTSSRQAVTLQSVTTIPVAAPVTGAALSADKTRLALLTDQGAYLFLVNGNLASAGRVKPVFSPFQHAGMEGATFAGNGLLVSSESRDLFLFNRPAFQVR